MTDLSWRSLSVQSTAILRQVLVPIYLEGCSTTETAKRIGIPLSSVRLLVDYFANEVQGLEPPDFDA
jgi:DNA-directed RNA polymerase specialized sigma24 family protein